MTRSCPMGVGALTLATLALLPNPRPSLARPAPPLAAGRVGNPDVAAAPNPHPLRYRELLSNVVGERISGG